MITDKKLSPLEQRLIDLLRLPHETWTLQEGNDLLRALRDVSIEPFLYRRRDWDDGTCSVGYRLKRGRSFIGVQDAEISLHTYFLNRRCVPQPIDAGKPGYGDGADLDVLPPRVPSVNESPDRYTPRRRERYTSPIGVDLLRAAAHHGEQGREELANILGPAAGKRDDNAPLPLDDYSGSLPADSGRYSGGSEEEAPQQMQHVQHSSGIQPQSQKIRYSLPAAAVILLAIESDTPSTDRAVYQAGEIVHRTRAESDYPVRQVGEGVTLSTPAQKRDGREYIPLPNERMSGDHLHPPVQMQPSHSGMSSDPYTIQHGDRLYSLFRGWSIDSRQERLRCGDWVEDEEIIADRHRIFPGNRIPSKSSLLHDCPGYLRGARDGRR